MVERCPLDAMTTGARVSLPKQAGWALAMIATWATILLGFSCLSQAEPLDYDPFAAGGPQFFFSRIEGRMGFNQDVGDNGTLNDLQTDLGLPTDNQTYRVLTSIRPLEHHNLRFYFSIPELYKGSKVLNRNLVTRTVIYPAGTQIASEMRTGMIGFGYDCDFLITPRLFAGLNGDLRYIDVRVRLGQNENSWEDTFTIDELTPCLGAHFQTALPVRKCLNVGAFGRVTYAITPNFLNYVDGLVGLRLGTKPLGQVVLDAKAGFEHESIFQELERSSGRRLELKRTGIVFSVEATF
jgi:hypothetical protein